VVTLTNARERHWQSSGAKACGSDGLQRCQRRFARPYGPNGPSTAHWPRSQTLSTRTQSRPLTAVRDGTPARCARCSALVLCSALDAVGGGPEYGAATLSSAVCWRASYARTREGEPPPKDRLYRLCKPLLTPMESGCSLSGGVKFLRVTGVAAGFLLAGISALIIVDVAIAENRPSAVGWVALCLMVLLGVAIIVGAARLQGGRTPKGR